MKQDFTHLQLTRLVYDETTKAETDMLLELAVTVPQIAASLETLKKAYAKQPDAEIAAHIGEVLWQMGRKDEARTIWNEANQAHPGNEALTATIKRFLP